jgi:predicted outer membrane repeat protein
MSGPDITENIADHEAGAIQNYGTLTINDGQITENVAKDGFGGAIVTKFGTLNLNGTVISYNTALGPGGAIYSTGITNLAYKNRARIFGNNASKGGGIFIHEGGHLKLQGLFTNC